EFRRVLFRSAGGPGGAAWHAIAMARHTVRSFTRTSMPGMRGGIAFAAALCAARAPFAMCASAVAYYTARSILRVGAGERERWTAQRHARLVRPMAPEQLLDGDANQLRGAPYDVRGMKEIESIADERGDDDALAHRWM